MDERKALEIMSGGGGLGASLLRAGLLCAAGPYAAAMGARRWLYRRGTLASHTVDAPVIPRIRAARSRSKATPWVRVAEVQP